MSNVFKKFTLVTLNNRSNLKFIYVSHALIIKLKKFLRKFYKALPIKIHTNVQRKISLIDNLHLIYTFINHKIVHTKNYKNFIHGVLSLLGIHWHNFLILLIEIF